MVIPIEPAGDPIEGHIKDFEFIFQDRNVVLEYFDYIKRIEDIIIELDYEEFVKQNSKHFKDSAFFEVAYKIISILPNKKGNYTIKFTRTFKKDHYNCEYRFNSDVQSFTLVYPDRLKHIVYSEDSMGNINLCGRFEDLLDEKPEERLKRLFESEGISGLEQAVCNYDSYDKGNSYDESKSDDKSNAGFHEGNTNYSAQLKRGEISINKYLEKAKKIFLPYEINTPVSIQYLQQMNHKNFFEIWKVGVVRCYDFSND